VTVNRTRDNSILTERNVTSYGVIDYYFYYFFYFLVLFKICVIIKQGNTLSNLILV